MLQPQFKSHNINEVLGKLFQIVPDENPYSSRDPQKCQRCAVVGNSGNLRGSGYGQDIDGHDFVMRWVAGATAEGCGWLLLPRDGDLRTEVPCHGLSAGPAGASDNG